MTLPTPTAAAAALKALAERWQKNTLKETQAFHSWFNEFCDAVGVEKPGPEGSGSYCFEQAIKVQNFDGADTTNFIDCWKLGHFALEAKAGGTGSNETLLRKAYKQIKSYVAAEPGTIPPYLMVVDVPREIIVWDRWSGAFGDFAAGRRMLLDTLHQRPDDILLLQDVMSQPQVRDPRGKALQVSRDIAGKLAQLAATFERRGFESERVARFLMRCVFCFFAEDVGLLPKKLFHRTLETARETGDGEHVAEVLTSLWRTMDQGGMFGAEKIARFNGHFFKTLESLPLEPKDVTLLIEAAGFDWSRVEPSIFGTLLVRALDAKERHKLGAEYTPREYIERLVEPTVVEPIRERWSAVQARMTQLEESAKKGDRKKAEQEVLDFHKWLRGLRFLDPACGSGNFLYVTMAAVKRIELEVLNEVARLHGGQEGLVLDEVHPRQFYGIEVNWWAREIAELTLWIGYHQFWREAHGGRTPPIPILEDTGTIECRDAILAWDKIVHRPEKDRPDPTPRITHPVTNELVPDPNAKLPYMEYVGARQAEWPAADFIVGNPPYIGDTAMREALGSGYVDALRSAYSELPAGIDLVMYWWWRGVCAISSGPALRTGFITTNSITQTRNRRVVAEALKHDITPVWLIRDHPWTDDADGAAVRVTLTVLAAKQDVVVAVLDSAGQISGYSRHPQINSDLTVALDVSGAAGVGLAANDHLSFAGFQLYGAGFILESTEALDLINRDPSHRDIVKPYLNARDLVGRPRDNWVVDFGLRSEEQAREYPVLFDIVRTRVKSGRDANRRESLAETWWRFGYPRIELRAAIDGLSRFIVTPETSKFRLFAFLPSAFAPDNRLTCIASDDPYHLGTLSSTPHSVWALSLGARLEDRPVYTKGLCFDPFPFPDPDEKLKATIGAVAERLDKHRKDAIARDERVTMTGMYNVVEKLKSGEALTPKERAIHEIAACGVLKDIHHELDVLVAKAYGWEWPMEREEILERLVALHDERVEEEKRGKIRWLRPEYQIPRFAPDKPAAELGIKDAPAAPKAAKPELLAWPATAVEQLAALGALVARRPVTVSEAGAAFEKADAKLVARHLETLSMLGEVVERKGTFSGVRGVG